MNPLFLEKSNFLVADGDGEVLGAGQIRPLGSFFELASLVVREDARHFRLEVVEVSLWRRDA